MSDWRSNYTADQYVEVLQNQIEILEGNRKRCAGVDYRLGREDEREAVLNFLRFGCADSPERKRWVQMIEDKKHLSNSVKADSQEGKEKV